MSKIGQEIFEAQEFATENYNVARDEFVKLADNAFSKNPILQKWTIEEYDVIQNDLREYDRYVTTGEADASV